MFLCHWICPEFHEIYKTLWVRWCTHAPIALIDTSPSHEKNPVWNLVHCIRQSCVAWFLVHSHSTNTCSAHWVNFGYHRHVFSFAGTSSCSGGRQCVRNIFGKRVATGNSHVQFYDVTTLKLCELRRSQYGRCVLFLLHSLGLKTQQMQSCLAICTFRITTSRTLPWSQCMRVCCKYYRT